MSDGRTRDEKKEERARRLAEELRANLQRRKQQSRARRAGAADESEGLPASGSAEGKDD